MPSAALLRQEIERSLAGRFPAALTHAPRTIRKVAPTGIAQVDALLDGGLPVGAISELTGPELSGRTSLALAFLARRTAEGRVCAWVDVNDAFDPESAAASGVALRQLLWVRCSEAEHRARQKARAMPWTRLDQAPRAKESSRRRAASSSSATASASCASKRWPCGVRAGARRAESIYRSYQLRQPVPKEL